MVQVRAALLQSWDSSVDADWVGSFGDLGNPAALSLSRAGTSGRHFTLWSMWLSGMDSREHGKSGLVSCLTVRLGSQVCGCQGQPGQCGTGEMVSNSLSFGAGFQKSWKRFVI